MVVASRPMERGNDGGWVKERFETKVKESAQVIRSCEAVADVVALLTQEVLNRLKRGGTILIFGNGGSAAQALHFSGELLGRFKKERGSLRAVALVGDPATVTAVGNDYGFEQVFSRQVDGLARTGDLVIGLSTSGRSANVLKGLQAGRQRGAMTVLLTGARCPDGDWADLVIRVPAEETDQIQEAHLIILHFLCQEIDRSFPDRQEGDEKRG